MATGFASAEADNVLNAYLRHVDYPGNTAVWMKLHTGSPGSAGTTNAAGNTTRQQLTCSASSGGTINNSVALTWTSVNTSETYTFFSLWTASSAGTMLGSGTMTANAVTSGDTFTVAINGFTGTVSVAA